MERVKLEKLLAKIAKYGLKENNVSYYIRNSEGGEYEFFNNVCFSGIIHSLLEFGHIEELIFWINRPCGDYQTRYGHYIINDSWLSHVFLTKDVEAGLKDGFYMDVDKPWIDIFAGMSMLREMFARKNGKPLHGNPEKWEEFGVSKDLAICLVNCYQEGYHTEWTKGVLKRSTYPGGHVVYPCEIKYEVFKGDLSSLLDKDKPSLKEAGFVNERIHDLFPRFSGGLLNRDEIDQKIALLKKNFPKLCKDKYTFVDTPEIRKFIVDQLEETNCI